MTEDDAREAERYEKLAAAAYDRFKTRLDWEWKARLALWTALAVGTGFALSTDAWQLTESEKYIGAGLALIIVIVYGVMFALPVHKLHRKDIVERLDWEWKVQQLCDPALGARPADPVRERWAILLSWGQFIMTCLFATSLAVAILSKESGPSRRPAKIVIEGREADSILFKADKHP